MRKILFVPVIALSLAAMPALAKEQAGQVQPGWLSVEQIKQKLTDQGYQVRDVEVGKKGYDVYAIDQHGKRMEVKIDPKTGDIIGDANDD